MSAASWSRCTGAGKFRRDVLSESCAAVLGIDTRLAEINDLLQHRGGVPRCECGSAGVPRHALLPQLRRAAARSRRAGDRERRVREHRRRSSAASAHPLMHPAAGLGSREAALLAAEWTCPRCGAPRDAASAHCIECGLRLPELHGAVASFRRRWVRRIGWYPGDWVWAPLLALRPRDRRRGGRRGRQQASHGQQRTARRDVGAAGKHRAAVPRSERAPHLAGAPERLDGRPLLLPGAERPRRCPRDGATCSPRQTRAGRDARLEQLRRA